MSALYLLSHQDDEIGVMHVLASTARERGERAVCVYLTDGAWEGVSSATRNSESLRVLDRLGVPRGDVHFLGERVGIGDGRLVERLEPALEGLRELVHQSGPVARVVTHAWEGGHHDHDAAHILGRVLAQQLGIVGAARQYSLYRAGRGRTDMVFASPPPGPAIEALPVSLRQTLGYLAMLRHYRSQARVMMQLAPRLVGRLLLDRVQKLQHLPPAAALQERPAARLLYEQWGFYTYERFREHAAPFLARHLLIPCTGSDAAAPPGRAT